MPNICLNQLTISGPSEEIKRFKDGLMKENGSYQLASSYLPMPQEIKETPINFFDIGYDAFFNPDPEGYLRVLELDEIKERGIKTREELMEFVKKEMPESYEEGLKINENLFNYGSRNWYWWGIANWGSKWPDFCTELVEQSSTHLVFEFQSAYSPLLLAVDYIASLFPELSFDLEYENYDGLFYKGFAPWQHGECIEGHCEDIEIIDGPEEGQIPQASTA